MTVEYLDEEPNGLATMIGGLIEANVAAHPERAALLRPAVVAIIAGDAHVSITLRLRRDGVEVLNGLSGHPDVVVRADTQTLTELTAVPLRFGFPDAMTRGGRAVTRKLFGGALDVRGLVRHPGIVSRLNRLLSVS